MKPALAVSTRWSYYHLIQLRYSLIKILLCCNIHLNCHQLVDNVRCMFKAFWLKTMLICGKGELEHLQILNTQLWSHPWPHPLIPAPSQPHYQNSLLPLGNIARLQTSLLLTAAETLIHTFICNIQASRLLQQYPLWNHKQSPHQTPVRIEHCCPPTDQYQLKWSHHSSPPCPLLAPG